MNNELYETFIKQYHINHELCPKCGSDSYESTLMGCVFNYSNPNEYKDSNKCYCNNCNDIHIYHDRISLQEFKSKR